MNELEIIKKLNKITKKKSPSLNFEDDVFFDKKSSLVISLDTYNENIHYVKFKYPDLIIKKVIRSSISDLLCKGVSPKYIFLSFSGNKDNFSKKNISKILLSLKKEQKRYGFDLSGGDTNYSKISSFTICSVGISKKIVYRNKSKLNDDIYVTGDIGDPYIGMLLLKNKKKIPTKLKRYFIDKFYKPNLAYGFHSELLKFATAAIDVSDGLLLDMNKLINKSKLKFEIDLNKIPLSKNLKKLIAKNKKIPSNYYLNGDDYQILFTSKVKNRSKILRYAKKWNQRVSIIGKITKKNENFIKKDGKINKIKDYQGFIHNTK